MDNTSLKLLFIINPGSGKNQKHWPDIIRNHSNSADHTIELMDLPEADACSIITKKINEYKPDRVVAVGGDGTVRLVAQCLIHTNIGLGLVHAGSANGMAKELEIPTDDYQALDLIVNGKTKKIHVLQINDQLCIHLSDIGFNAYVVKKFESSHKRGMFGYIKASWFVLWNQPKMEVEIQQDNQSVVKIKAAMIVLANGTSYGSGAVINPNGKLNDDLFEVVIVKKVSFIEIFKMMTTHARYNPEKTELFQTHTLQMKSRRKVHFQVDGEYIGKVNSIQASLIPAAVEVIVPNKSIHNIL